MDGDKVIVTPGGAKGTLLALDKNTGKPLWQSKEWTDEAQYASPIVATIGGVRQYIQQTEKTVAGVAADDGRLLWKADRPEGRVAVIPTPIEKDGLVLRRRRVRRRAATRSRSRPRPPAGSSPSSRSTRTRT